MASEYLLAGLLACQHSTFFKIAAKRRTDAKVESIAGDLHFDDAGDIVRITLRFRIAAPPSVADPSVQTILRLTEAACTVSKVLKVPVESTFERA